MIRSSRNIGDPNPWEWAWPVKCWHDHWMVPLHIQFANITNLAAWTTVLNFEKCPFRGHQVVVLSVTLSVTLWQKNFNLGHNFWNVRNIDFTFGMHTQLMKPFQMTPRSMTLTVSFILKIANFGLCCHRGHSCFTNTPVLFFLEDWYMYNCYFMIFKYWYYILRM